MSVIINGKTFPAEYMVTPEEKERALLRWQLVRERLSEFCDPENRKKRRIVPSNHRMKMTAMNWMRDPTSEALAAKRARRKPPASLAGLTVVVTAGTVGSMSDDIGPACPD